MNTNQSSTSHDMPTSLGLILASVCGGAQAVLCGVQAWRSVGHARALYLAGMFLGMITFAAGSRVIDLARDLRRARRRDDLPRA